MDKEEYRSRREKSLRGQGDNSIPSRYARIVHNEPGTRKARRKDYKHGESARKERRNG